MIPAKRQRVEDKEDATEPIVARVESSSSSSSCSSSTNSTNSGTSGETEGSYDSFTDSTFHWSPNDSSSESSSDLESSSDTKSLDDDSNDYKIYSPSYRIYPPGKLVINGDNWRQQQAKRKQDKKLKIKFF